MDWKSLYNSAFPAPESFKKYDWPDLPSKQPMEPYNFPELPNQGPWESGQFGELPGPAPWPSSQFPALPGPAPWEQSQFDELPQQSAWPGSSYPSMRWVDHVGDWAFRIEIEGEEAGYFSKVEGLTVQIEAIEYQHSDDITPRKRMGKIKVDNVRLVKGYVNSPALFEWCEKCMDGDISRKSVSIVLLADDHSAELCRYNLYEVWPCKWSGFKLDGKGQGALVEDIELIVEQIKRA